MIIAVIHVDWDSLSRSRIVQVGQQDSILKMVSPEVLLSDVTEGFAELGPVELTWSKGECSEYPLVQPIAEVHAAKLAQDFIYVRHSLSRHYLSEREHQLPLGIARTKEVLKAFGFDGRNYSAYSMKSIDGAHWLDVPQSTRDWVDANFPKNARVHYAVAAVGWSSAWHVDCRHFRLHGFRVHVPLSTSAHYEFRVGPVTKNFELKPGFAYFVNVAVSHRAHNPENEERVSILLQLMSDSPIRSRVLIGQ